MGGFGCVFALFFRWPQGLALAVVTQQEFTAQWRVGQKILGIKKRHDFIKQALFFMQWPRARSAEPGDIWAQGQLYRAPR